MTSQDLSAPISGVVQPYLLFDQRTGLLVQAAPQQAPANYEARACVTPAGPCFEMEGPSVVNIILGAIALYAGFTLFAGALRR